MDRRQFLAAVAGASLVAARKKPSVAERAACSSLAQRMQPPRSSPGSDSCDEQPTAGPARGRGPPAG